MRTDITSQKSGSTTPAFGGTTSIRHKPPRAQDPRLNPKNTPLPQGSDILYPQESFRRALARERSLTLRFGHCFSLLEVDLQPESTHHHPARVISHQVVQRIRETDIAGWLSPTCLGIILSDTSPTNAWCLAHQLTAQVAEHHVVITCRVAPYRPPLDKESTTTGPTDDTAEIDALLFGRVPRWKRTMDVVIASLGLAALTPLLLLIATGIEVVSPGPILFRQKRIGHLGQPYTCWKFRSMRPHADQTQHRDHVRQLLSSDVPLTKLEQGGGDDRLIPLGRVLRASGLDELPQLVNVLCGQMSLVGPRPCMPYEFDEFRTWQRDRCMTPPGLTGMWQVNGKNKTTFAQMMRLDVQYIKHRSLPLDLLLMLRTPLVLFSQLSDCLTKASKRAPAGVSQLKPHARRGIR